MNLNNIGSLKHTFLSFALLPAAAVLMLLLTFSAHAQRTTAKDTVVLDGFINADRTLTPDKTYLVKYNVKVAKNVTLTVNPGTEILFDPETSIVLEGGLVSKGAPNNFNTFTSTDPNQPGNGIVVRGNEGKDIDVSYTVFTELMVPFNFDSEWFRRNVKIEKNVFTDLYTGESNILISSPIVAYERGVQYVSDFSFSQNAFYNNWGSIFIENFEDNILKLKFNNNLITNNVVYGIDIGIPSNTPVFGLFEDKKSEYKMQMENNSIFGNSQINSSTDTIIREISVGIQGDGEEFRIPNNFFLSRNPDYISSTFDHFFQNSELPLLRPEPILTEPKEATPPHIFRVKINGSEVTDYGSLPEVDSRNVQFDVTFNKPVTFADKTQLETIAYDSLTGTLQQSSVTLSESKWSPDRQTFSFTVSNASFMQNPYAYVVLTNFKDQEGFIVPDFTIGRRKAINRYKRTTVSGVKTSELISGRGGIIDVDVEGGAFLPDEKSVEAIETLADLGAEALGPYRSLSGTWEVGVLAGVSNYFGTLPYTLLDRSDFNFAIGVFGQYNYNKWLSFRAMLWYGKISGSDINADDPDRRQRLLNFKNHLVEGSLTAHWHLLKYGTSRGEKFTPTIFAGISFYRNKPMGRIYLYEDLQDQPVYLTYLDGQYRTDGQGEDVWVSLRDIGTEGQTVGGVDPEAFSNSTHSQLYTDREAPKQYSKFQVSFPIGLSLDYIIYNKWVIGLELGVRISTTKYLDDASGYYWDRGTLPSSAEIDANYGLPIGYHQSIIDVNPEIQAKGISDPVPNVITVTDPNNGITSEYHTAALLSNPSLVNVDENLMYDESGNLVLRNLGINSNQYTNDAYTFSHGKKGNPSGLDHYAFFGVRISKVLRRGGNEKVTSPRRF